MKRYQWVGPLFFFILWVVVSKLKILSPTLLPSLSDTIKTFFRLIVTGSILPDFVETMVRMSIGYSIAIVAGVPIGILLGYSQRLYKSFEIPLDFFRSLPVTTLYPLFVLLFGIGHYSKIAMVVAACIFVIVLNSAYGVIQSSPTRRLVAQVFGATEWQKFKDIIFFESLPQTVIGLRVAISYALIVEIVCEMFMGAQRGLGQRVFEAYNTYSIEDLYAIALLVGFTGYAINKLFVFFEKRILFWVGK